MRHVPAQSRHDSSVCACFVESPALSFHFGLSLGFDLCLFVISCFYFSCFYFSMLLLLFFRSLVRVASLSSLFSIWARVAVFAWTVLRGGLAALCPVSQLSVWSRGALLRRLGLRRCECDSKLFYGRSCTPLPTPIASSRSRRTGALQCSRSLTLLLVGRTGWYSICRGDSDRVICHLHQLRPPLCGPPHRRPSPRAPRAGLAREKILSRFFPNRNPIIYIYI